MILKKIVLLFLFQSAFACAAEVGIFKGKNICLYPASNSIQVCDSHMLGFSPNSLTNNKDYGFSSNSFSNNGEEAVASKNNIGIYNYIQNPDSDTDWGAYILSGLAMFVSVGTTIWQRRTQKSDAINDGFWVREVIMPQVNEGVTNLCSRVKGELKTPSADFTAAYRTDLLPLLNELRDSFSLLSAFPNSGQYAQKLNGFCDNFDDALSDHVNEPLDVRLEDVSGFRINLTKELMLIHKKIT